MMTKVCYIDSKSFLSLTKTIIVLMISCLLIYLFTDINLVHLLDSIDVSITFIIIILSTNSVKFYKSTRVFIAFTVYLLILSICKMKAYFIIKRLIETDNQILILKFITSDFGFVLDLIFWIMVIFYYTNKYLNEHNYEKKYNILYIVSITILLILYNLDLAIINIMIIISIYIFLLYKKKNLQLISKSLGINIFNIYSIISIIICLLILYLNIFNNYLNFMLFIFVYKFLRLTCTIIIYYIIKETFFNNPYYELSNNIELANEKLSKVNLEIEMKNIALEQSLLKAKENNKYLENLFYTLPISLILFNVDNGKIINLNKSFIKEYTQDNLDNFIDKNIFEVLNIKDKELLLNSEGVEGYISINNKINFLYIDIFTINNNRCIVTIKNITQIKRRQAVQKDINNKAIEDIRSDFLSNISHDLKTPINVIYGSTQLQRLIIREKDIEILKKYNQVNKDNCMTLIRLTNNLIDSSKLTYDYLKPQLRLHNMVELIEETCDKFIQYIENKGIEFCFDTEEEEIYVECDEEFIQRITMNIISNSIKHTKSGKISVIIKSLKDLVVIEFIDTGEGMEKDFLDKRAFKKYEVSKSSNYGINKNSGIGLFVIKNLVELQGGNILVESKHNIGTKIILSFNRE